MPSSSSRASSSSRRPPSDRPDPSLAARAAEARANGTSSAPPPEAPTHRDLRLATLTSLSSTLASLISAFDPPPPGTLTFQPDAPQKLAFTPSNAPFLAHEDALVKLLTQLDGVESDGDDVIRAERKRLVKEVDAELERLDGIKKAETERAAARAGKGDELRERKARVDRMLMDAAQVGAKTENAAKAYANNNNEHTAQHEAAEHALYNEHGKRAEQSRGRGSPRSGDEESAHRHSENGAPPSDRFSKVRRHASPGPPSSSSSSNSNNKPLPPPPQLRTSAMGHPINPRAKGTGGGGGQPFFASLPSRFDPAARR